MLTTQVLSFALLGGLAFAVPIEPAEPQANVAKRQFPGFPGFPGFPRPTTTPPTVPIPSPTTAPGGGGTGGIGGTSSQTRNDIDNGICRDVSVIYARGTSEPGNVGYSTGPAFFDALNSQLGASRVAVQGVAYPASAAGNANLGQDGAGPMATEANKAASQCPNTKIVLSGYSQGAMVVHAAAKQLTSIDNRIAAVVLFGDPLNGQAIQGIPATKVKTFCHTDDSVCKGSPVISSGHLTYSSDAPAAASFVAANI